MLNMSNNIIIEAIFEVITKLIIKILHKSSNQDYHIHSLEGLVLLLVVIFMDNYIIIMAAIIFVKVNYCKQVIVKFMDFTMAKCLN